MHARRFHFRLRDSSLNWALVYLSLLWLGVSHAQPVAPTVLWFEADPWVQGSTRWLGGVFLPDWTQTPTGPVGTLQVVTEHFEPGVGLGTPIQRPAGPPPAGAGFALVNQYAPDISVFLLEPPRTPPGDTNGNALPDDWELHHFGRLGVNPDDDADGDGFTQLAELEAGSDPNDPRSQPPLPGILGWWSGNGAASDRLGAHPGNWQGVEQYAPGRLDDAFQFNGQNYVRIPDAPELRPTTALTLAAWVRWDFNTCNLTPILVRTGASGLADFGLYLNCQGARFTVSQAFSAFTAGPAFSPHTNTWYHLAASWDGTELRFYINGRPVLTQRVPGSFGLIDNTPGHDLLLGHDGRTQFARAAVDEVVLVGRVLSADEVRWLAGGNGGRRGLIGDEDLVLEGTDQSLWRIGVDGTGASLLSRGFDARLSPDRRYLAFRREPTVADGVTAETLWTRDLLTGAETPRFRFDLGRTFETFDWAADSAAVVLVNRFSKRIERRELVDGSRTLLVDTASFLGDVQELSVHPSTGRLAWHLAAFDRTLAAPWTAGADGANPQPIPGTNPTDFFRRFRWPTWASEGNSLALASGPNLFRVEADGTGLIALTQNVGAGGEPTLVDAPPIWTPDAQHVAALVTYGGLTEDTRLRFVAADGSGLKGEFRSTLAPLARVVFAGGLPVASAFEVDVRLSPPLVPGGAPQLEFELPPNALDAVLETSSRLDSAWDQPGATRVFREGRWYWVVPFDPDVSVRFFRLRRGVR